MKTKSVFRMIYFPVGNKHSIDKINYRTTLNILYYVSKINKLDYNTRRQS